MAVTELAEVSVAYYLGEVIAMSGIPIVGLILLIVGLRSGPAPGNCLLPDTHQQGRIRTRPRRALRSTRAFHTSRNLRCPQRHHSITRTLIRRPVRHGEAQRSSSWDR